MECNRVERIVAANIQAVHAYHVLMVRKTGKDMPAFHSLLGDSALLAIVEEQRWLLSNQELVEQWANGCENSAVEQALQGITSSGLRPDDSSPVNVLIRHLQDRTGDHQAIAPIANLYQTVLEINRDGTVLQQQMDLYIRLGQKVYVGQLGLGGSDEELLQTGRELEVAMPESPFGVGAADWQIAGRKIWNWGQKKLHIRDDKVLAREILGEGDFEPLVAKLKALPSQRIAVIGHSFTGSAHWASPSSFTQIAAAILGILNEEIEVRHWTGGDLRAAGAHELCFHETLQYRPAKAFLFFLDPVPEDIEPLRAMAAGFKDAGITAFIFPHGQGKELEKTLPSLPLRLADFRAALAASPHKDKFLSLDGVHMTESYHRLMAKEMLRLLVENSK